MNRNGYAAKFQRDIHFSIAGDNPNWTNVGKVDKLCTNNL